MIEVGTAGYSYADWRGPFYPPGLPQSQMLEHYARRFSAVELDFTYYRMPSLRTMASMVRRTGPGFTFCVKANRAMTHERAEEPAEVSRAFAEFLAAMHPLVDADRFGCLLLQFPWSFRPNAASTAYLRYCRELLADVPSVVELRNADWVSPEELPRLEALLTELGFSFCCVDEPQLKGLMPPVVLATGPIGYVRFHGRNKHRWWQHEVASERYDYLYSQTELAEWTDKIRRLADEVEKTYVFFNNCHAGQAASNASQMMDLLGLNPPRDGLF